MFRNRKYKTPRTKAGQSTVEYILIVTAVVATIIAMSGAFKAKLNNSIEMSQNGMVNIANTLAQSHDGSLNQAVGPKITGINPADPAYNAFQ